MRHRSIMFPSVPVDWNSWCRFQPNAESEFQQVSEFMEDKIARHFGTGILRLPFEIRQLGYDAIAVVREAVSKSKAPKKDDVFDLTRVLREFACGPIDRCRGDVAVLCPARYIEQSRRFVSDAGWQRPGLQFAAEF